MPAAPCPGAWAAATASKERGNAAGYTAAAVPKREGSACARSVWGGCCAELWHAGAPVWCFHKYSQPALREVAADLHRSMPPRSHGGPFICLQTGWHCHGDPPRAACQQHPEAPCAAGTRCCPSLRHGSRRQEPARQPAHRRQHRGAAAVGLRGLRSRSSASNQVLVPVRGGAARAEDPLSATALLPAPAGEGTAPTGGGTAGSRAAPCRAVGLPWAEGGGWRG